MLLFEDKVHQMGTKKLLLVMGSANGDVEILIVRRLFQTVFIDIYQVFLTFVSMCERKMRFYLIRAVTDFYPFVLGVWKFQNLDIYLLLMYCYGLNTNWFPLIFI